MIGPQNIVAPCNVSLSLFFISEQPVVSVNCKVRERLVSLISCTKTYVHNLAKRPSLRNRA
jgi:hypothetical protein